MRHTWYLNKHRSHASNQARVHGTTTAAQQGAQVHVKQHAGLLLQAAGIDGRLTMAP